MINKLPMMILMTVIIYLTPIISQIPNEYIKTNLFAYTLFGTYILSYLDLIFYAKKRSYKKMIILSLITKIAFLPIIALLFLFGLLTIIVIIGSGVIITAFILWFFIWLLTSLYSIIAIYNYSKVTNTKYNMLYIISQFLFPFDIIGLIVFLATNKDK